jgi:cyclopropane-fatty-acyl-phospholipid synthase
MTVGDAFNPAVRVDRGSAVRGVRRLGHRAGRGPPSTWSLRSKRGLDYLLTAPSTARPWPAPYLQEDLVLEPIDEGNPYDVLRFNEDNLAPSRPSLRELPELALFFRVYRPQIHEIPKEETPGQLRRLARGSPTGGPATPTRSTTTTTSRTGSTSCCSARRWPTRARSTRPSTRPLEEAQEEKFDLVCRKLELRPVCGLLDVGCGWGGMVRHAVLHYGVTAVGVTLSKEQAGWGAERMAPRSRRPRRDPARRLPRRGRGRVRRGVVDRPHRAHRGGQLPAYFRFLRSKLLEGGRLLNHCITRPDNQHPGIPSRGFINRYVFPDGGLTGSGDHRHSDGGPGVRGAHHENLREHYAMTTRDWSNNLSANWDAAVAEAGLNVRAGLGAVPRRVAAVVRAQPDPAPPGARVEDDAAASPGSACADLGQLTSGSSGVARPRHQRQTG